HKYSAIPTTREQRAKTESRKPRAKAESLSREPKPRAKAESQSREPKPRAKAESLMSCSANSPHKSQIRTINLSSRPERSGVEGPCVFKQPVLFTPDFQMLFISGTH